MATQTTQSTATARILDAAISSKHSVEISNALRFKTTSFAKKFLSEVVALKRPVRFTRYDQDLGHKPGVGAGRYPQKAAAQFLKLIESVEANAQFKGLNVTSLKIIKLVANKAAIPQSGGRIRRAHKRTHLEVEVCESAVKKEVKPEAKKESLSSSKNKSQKVEPKVESKDELTSKDAASKSTNGAAKKTPVREAKQ